MKKLPAVPPTFDRATSTFALSRVPTYARRCNVRLTFRIVPERELADPHEPIHPSFRGRIPTIAGSLDAISFGLLFSIAGLSWCVY